MKATDLLGKDKSLCLVQENTDFEIEKICPSTHKYGSALHFISSKKHLRFTDIESPSCLVIDLKTYEALEEEDQKKLASSFNWIYTSPSSALSMCVFSKVFYEKFRDSDQDIVDGRQLGTTSIDPSADIAQSVFLGSNVVIEKNVIIHPKVTIMSGSHIGEGSIIYPGVTLYPDVKLGKNCRIHSGAKIGADGFGYHFENGTHHKIWHYGGVEIGDDVEIGANSCVDGGTFAPTKIGRQCKIDNQVQLGHNVVLGTGVILCGQVAIGGSTKVGDFCVFAGQSAVADNVEIGAGSKVGACAGVNCSWPAGSVIGGHPARNIKEWMRGIAYVRKNSLRK